MTFKKKRGTTVELISQGIQKLYSSRIKTDMELFQTTAVRVSGLELTEIVDRFHAETLGQIHARCHCVRQEDKAIRTLKRLTFRAQG